MVVQEVVVLEKVVETLLVLPRFWFVVHVYLAGSRAWKVECYVQKLTGTGSSGGLLCEGFPPGPTTSLALFSRL